MASPSRDGTAARRARESSALRLDELVHSGAEDDLRKAASNAALGEDLALAMLARRDLPISVLEDMGHNAALLKHRKVQSALVRHGNTPRHVSIPIVRRMYTFELLQLTLFPGLSPDLRVTMEQTLIARLETLSAGERLTLAHRGPGGLIPALLLDKDERVVRAALENPAMNEERLVRALMHRDTPESLIQTVCRHAKWSLRRDVRIALLLNPKTPLAHLLAIAQSLPQVVLRDLLEHAAMDSSIKSYLRREVKGR